MLHSFPLCFSLVLSLSLEWFYLQQTKLWESISLHSL